MTIKQQECTDLTKVYKYNTNHLIYYITLSLNLSLIFNMTHHVIRYELSCRVLVRVSFPEQSLKYVHFLILNHE